MKKNDEYKIPSLSFDSKKLKKYSKRVSEINNELDEIIKRIKKENSFMNKIKKIFICEKDNYSFKIINQNFDSKNSEYRAKILEREIFKLDTKYDYKAKKTSNCISHFA